MDPSFGLSLSQMEFPAVSTTDEGSSVNLCQNPETNTKQVVQEKVRRTRSRLGCYTCKKLKIKCDEQKPSCEYCKHRGRRCVYPVPEQQDTKSKLVPTRRFKRQISKEGIGKMERNYIEAASLPMTSADLHNRSMIRLNSMSAQMQVTNFESKLLKIFLDFGPLFFAFDVDKNAHKFWNTEAPSLCMSSNLVKQSVYAMSSSRLLHFYGSSFFQGASPENLDVFKRSIMYQERTTQELMDLLGRYDYTHLDSDMIGQITVVKMIMISCKCIFPRFIKEGLSTAENCGVSQLMTFIQQTSPVWAITISRLRGTKYFKIFEMEENVASSSFCDFEFIHYLRDYVNRTRSDSFDVSQLTYHHAIAMMELGADRATILKFPLPFFKSIVRVSRDEDFISLFKTNDHTAMKIVFYLSSLCSALDFRLFPGLGIWDEYVEIYKNHSFQMFGRFEDDFDKNVYDAVIAGRYSKVPYDLRLLKIIGRPLDGFFNEYSHLNNEERYPTLLHRQQFERQQKMWTDITSRF